LYFVEHIDGRFRIDGCQKGSDRGQGRVQRLAREELPCPSQRVPRIRFRAPDEKAFQDLAQPFGVGVFRIHLSQRRRHGRSQLTPEVEPVQLHLVEKDGKGIDILFQPSLHQEGNHPGSLVGILQQQDRIQ